MNAIRVLGIIGIIWVALCFTFMLASVATYNYASATGWGIFAMIYLLALSIVSTVLSKDEPKSPKKSGT